jgi:hypothetical protein
MSKDFSFSRFFHADKSMSKNGNGIHQAYQYYRLNSTVAGSNATGAQNIFGAGVTLAGATVYEFEIMVAFTKSAGTTSHSVSFGFGGTATLNNIGYSVINKTNNTSFVNLATTDTTQMFIQTAAATAITGTSTSAVINFVLNIKGTVSVQSPGGTFIPQYTLTAAPGGAYTTQIGSYMKISALSAAGAVTSIGSWA